MEELVNHIAMLVIATCGMCDPRAGFFILFVYAVFYA